MKRMYVIVPVFLLAIAAAAHFGVRILRVAPTALAQASTTPQRTTYLGSICKGLLQPDTDNLRYNQWGIYNWDNWAGNGLHQNYHPTYATQWDAASGYGRFNNLTSAYPIMVVCPLPITNVGSAVGLVDSVVLTGYDRSTTDNISCTLQQVDQNGTATYQASQSTSGGGPATGPVQLTWTPQAGSVNTVAALTLFCSIPFGEVGAGGAWFSQITTIQVNSHY